MGNILFYGERGIVNGIVLDIKNHPSKQKGFLKAIRFAGGNSPEWIDNITGADFIVEPSLSEFGNPDLIMIAYEPDNKKHVLFIEAKTHCYQDEAIDKTSSFNIRGSTSAINFQLALKFRFAEAFKKVERNDYIIECQEYYQNNYESQDKLRRRIKNKVVIEICDRFRNAQDFWFVALTNDSDNAIPYADSDFLPPIGDWENNKSRFGLVSYAMLEKEDVINRNRGYFGAAAKVFLGSPADTGYPEAKPLEPINRIKWTDEQRVAANKLIDVIQAATDYEFDVQNGSYSLSVNGIALIKILTQNDNSIILGLRNDGLPEGWKKYFTYGIFNIGVANKRKLFAFAKFDPKDDQAIERLSEYAIRYIDFRGSAEIERPITCPILRTINRTKWTDEQHAAVNRLIDAIQTATGCKFDEYSGSYSLSDNRETLIKAFTQDDNCIILGIRYSRLPADYSKYLTYGTYNIGVGNRMKAFVCAKFGAKDNQAIERLSEYAIRYIKKQGLGEKI